MSYDVNLKIDTGGAEPLEIDWFNYTYNISEMLYKAFPETVDEQRGGIYWLDGRPAMDCISLLHGAIYNMEQSPDDYRALNPENGWGSYEGCLHWLRRILTACEKHPKAYITIT